MGFRRAGPEQGDFHGVVSIFGGGVAPGAPSFPGGVGAAEALDQRRLVGMGLPVGGLRIADLQEFGVEFTQDRCVGRIAGKIVQLLRVGLEVEQFRLETDIVDVFPPSPPDHVGGRHGPGGMVFAEHDPAVIAWFGSNSAERAPRAFSVELGGEMRQDGLGQVDQADGRVAGTGIDARTRHDQRHRRRFLVHVGLAPQSPCAGIVAVIAGVDHGGVSAQTGLLERFEDPADIVVQPAAQAEIAGDRRQPLGLVAEPVLAVHGKRSVFPPRGGAGVRPADAVWAAAGCRAGRGSKNRCGTTSGKCGATRPT